MPLGPNPLPTVGDTNGTWGTVLNTYLAAIPQDVADTGTGGFALQNATPTILTWTAPNDGNMHVVTVVAEEVVTTAETGGLVVVSFTDPAGTARTPTAFAAGAGIGATFFFNAYLIQPNTAASLAQTSALTAGAAKVYAQIWAA